jgi:GTP cyclohydrolase I
VTDAVVHLRSLAGPPEIDLAAAQRAAGDLLAALGADLADESLRDTPRRMALMYAEMLTPAPFAPTTFPNDGGYDDEHLAPRGVGVVRDDQRTCQEFLSLTGGSRV